MGEVHALGGGRRWVKLEKNNTNAQCSSQVIKAESLGGTWWVLTKGSLAGAKA